MTSGTTSRIQCELKKIFQNWWTKFSLLKFRLLFVSTLILLLSTYSYSQLESDNWMYGYNYYITFNHSSRPDTIKYPFATSAVTGSGTISYSDKYGNLLFYGGSSGIYDKNFNIFPSVNISAGGQPLYNSSAVSDATQPFLAVPYPNHDSLFIIFHIRSDFNNQYHSQLYYSVLNMKLRNGLGEIEPFRRNILLLGGTDVAFKQTAISHCNKKDIWILGHYLQSNQYFSLLLTENGVTSTTNNFTGNFIPRVVAGNSDHPNNKGCMKVSASGKKFAAAFKGMNIIELFDFNDQTGTGINVKTLTASPSSQDTTFFSSHTNIYGPWGIEFSPSGDRLYVTSNYDMKVYSNQQYFGFVYQFDVSLSAVAQIQNSKYALDSLEGYDAGAIQIADNGKIYINVNDNLCEVANPEKSGSACGYRPLVVISGQQYPNLNLPTFLQSLFKYPIKASGNCSSQLVNFAIENLNSIQSIVWNFGDPASGANNTSLSLTPSHLFSSIGEYNVSAIISHLNGCNADTVSKIIHVGSLNIALGNDTTICKGDTLTLHSNVPGALVRWSNGSQDSILRITQAGTYAATVSFGDCFATDSINVSFQDLPVFTLGADITLCNDSTISLTPNMPFPNSAMLWSTGEITPTITVNSTGMYWLKIIDSVGCYFTDTANIKYESLPAFSLGADTNLCQTTLPLIATINGATSYLWNTGSINSILNVSQTGTYWVNISYNGCTYRDSISVTFTALPQIELGNDTTLCNSSTLLLNPGASNASYKWQNNSTSPTFLITSAGKYYTQASLDGCSSSDTIRVTYNQSPIFTFQRDLHLCPGQGIILQPIISTPGVFKYLWQDGSTKKFININSPGMYSLRLSNECGTSSGMISITEGVCQLYIPNAFTPNRDGMNDIFKPIYNGKINFYNFQLHNIWGEEIFRSLDIRTGWNGYYKGIQQPVGTYVWTLNISINDEKEPRLLKGKVLLLR